MPQVEHRSTELLLDDYRRELSRLRAGKGMIIGDQYPLTDKDRERRIAELQTLIAKIENGNA